MIYFDNAATTYPKPAAVMHAMADSMRYSGGNPGRGSHRLSMRAAEEVYLCRCAAAEMFDASPENVIFTSGATMSLNMAIKGALKLRGGGILISDLEHNSVRRPALDSCGDVRIFDSAIGLSGEERTRAILESIESLKDGVGVLCCTAASNICGAALPINEIGKLCRRHGIFFIVDGAQAGGCLPLSIEKDCIDALCLPGHKGLYGPMGVGLMILGRNVTLPTLLEGGSGTDSRLAGMPDIAPERYEAGTLPVPAIAGLRRGIEFVRRSGIGRIRAHEERLCTALRTGLERSLGSRVRIYAGEHHGSILLFGIDGIDPEELSAELDRHGICTRAGLHCSPLAHERLGSESAVRISFGVWNTMREVRELITVLRKSC